MGLKTKTAVYVGYDISHLTDKIKELENSKDDWIDGIKDWSDNYFDVKIGYDHHTKSIFGKKIFDTYSAFNSASEEGIIKDFNINQLETWHRTDIMLKYMNFQKFIKHITGVGAEPPILRFITWYS